jgi:hypothetical protein
MNHRAFFISFIVAVGCLGTIIIGAGCANIIPPEGGLRDSLPPVLVKASPETNTRNFADTRITLTLDEYVDLENEYQNVIISPVPNNRPTISRKLNTINIRIRDTLEPHTTYSINFGNSIKDVNEGNIMKNFTYVFSTGPTIDSLQFSGKVLLAETNETDSTLIVMLYTTPEDSAVYNKRPRYFTTLDGKGSFQFKNLPPGTFYVYAMKDEGRSFRYNPRQLFAFADSAILISSSTKPVTLYASAAEKEGSTPSGGSGGTSLRGNRGPGSSADKRLKYSTNNSGGKQNLMEKFIFTFETPLRDFDSTRIHFATDTTYRLINSGYKWTLDSSRKNLSFDYAWNENTDYHFIMEKEFATDTSGHQLLKNDTLSFSSRSKAEYGELLIRFRNLDLSLNPVLQFVQNNQVVNSFPLTATTFTHPLFEPGEYTIRILYDSNKNGTWDPGNFFQKRRQPERVRSVERKFPIKTAWKNQFEVAL